MRSVSTTPNQEAKHWCFTVNNYTDDEVVPTEEHYSYMVIGKEVGENGTPHLQGFVSFKKKMRRTQVSKLIPRAYLVVAKGTPSQAAAYCKKEGNWHEDGFLPAPGQQTAAASKKRAADYELAVEQAKRQKLYEIDPSILLRYGSSLRAIQKDHPIKMPDNDYLCGVWFVGKPGTGKSKSARWIYPEAYPKPLNKWWDGYQNEPYVILDDMEPIHNVLGHHIKQWADHYPFTAEQKGTSIRIRPAIICITSNYTIDEIFHDSKMAEAIARRFKVVNFDHQNWNNPRPKVVKQIPNNLYERLYTPMDQEA